MGLCLALHHRRAGLEMLHDRAEDGGFNMLPSGVFGLGHGHEIIAEEHAGHAFNRENAAGQRAFPGGVGAWEIGGSGVKHGLARQEFQRSRVRRGFGLNEHGRQSLSVPSDMRVQVWNVNV